MIGKSIVLFRSQRTKAKLANMGPRSLAQHMLRNDGAVAVQHLVIKPPANIANNEHHAAEHKQSSVKVASKSLPSTPPTYVESTSQPTHALHPPKYEEQTKELIKYTVKSPSIPKQPVIADIKDEKDIKVENFPDPQIETLFIDAALPLQIIKNISKGLEHICSLNQKKQSERTRIFDALKPEKISIHDYLLRMREYSEASESEFIAMLLILKKYSEISTDYINILNIHRLLITSLRISTKLAGDLPRNNAYFAKVGGIPLAQLNSYEAQLSLCLNWNFGLAQNADAIRNLRTILYNTSDKPTAWTASLFSAYMDTPNKENEEFSLPLSP